MKTIDLLRIQKDLGIALSTISRIRPALQRVLASALSVEGIDAGGIYLVNHSARTVELVAHRGLSRGFIQAVARYDVVAPMAKRIMRGRPVYRSHKQVQSNPLFVGEGFLSLAGFPIRYSRNVIAVMNLASRSCRSIPRFTRTVLGAIAEQIGIIVPRIRAETEWREAQKNLRSLFDTTGDLLFILDPKGCILEVNRAVPALLGYTRRQLLDRPFSDVHSRARQDEAEARVADLLAQRSRVCEVPLLSRSGRHIPVETRVTGGRWDGKRVLFAISRDMRERRQMEQEIIRISESEKVRVAQDIHDNLMQQLSAISMLAASLKQQATAGSPRAVEISDRIFTVSRDMLAAGRRVMHGLSPIAPIDGGIEQALQRLSGHVREIFGCDVRVHCDLEAGTMDPVVSTELFYVAQEAIRNAGFHGGATRIDVRLTTRAESGMLDVLDNGCGLNRYAEEHPGMGLRIMAYRADMIGGHLSVRPRRGGGTRVRCRFRTSLPLLKRDGV